MAQYEITILGAGNGGRAFSCYLSKLGHNVNLCFRTEKNIKKIKSTHIIKAQGEIEGNYKVNRVTTKYKEVIPIANVILVILPAYAHESVIRKVLPYLQNGQIILLNPGRTWGAIHIRNIIQEERPDINVFVGETQTLLFTCRKIKDTGVVIKKIKDKINYCFYPEYDNMFVQDIIEELFPQFQTVDDILITSLNNIGSVVHPATVLLNSGSISRAKPFSFYQDGMTREIVEVIKKIDDERCLIMERLGLPPISFLEWVCDSYGLECGSYYDAFRKIKAYEGIQAPKKMKTRYLDEDVPTGLVPLSSLGNYFNIPTPFIDSIITLASCMVGKDYPSIGRTIENVGLPIEILARAEYEFKDIFPPEEFSV